MDDPIVIATRSKPNPSHPECRIVYIDCPYCGREHAHGWPDPAVDPGHRRSHCAPRVLGGYYIKAPI